jgi:hypothetical protein
MMRAQIVITNQFGVFKSKVAEGSDAEQVFKINWLDFKNISLENERGEKTFFPETLYKNSVIQIVKLED